jgi:hypothetical protein
MKKTILSLVAAIVLIGCEPDNPLRGSTSSYNYLGIDNSGDALLRFDSELSGFETASSLDRAENAVAEKVYFEFNDYYVLFSNPNVLKKYDPDLNFIIEIPLPETSIASVDFISSTEALVTYRDSATVTEVDLFFNKTGSTYALPFIPEGTLAIRSESYANRLMMISESGALAYFDIRDNTVYDFAETGLAGATVIEHGSLPNLYVIKSDNENNTVVSYSLATGDELTRIEQQKFNFDDTEESFLGGVWGGQSIGYVVSDKDLYLLQDLGNNQIFMQPYGIDLSQYSPMTADVSQTLNSRGINILMQGDQSYVMNFEEVNPAAFTLNFPSRRIISMVPLD